jgi:site-specific DNA recombinase
MHGVKRTVIYGRTSRNKSQGKSVNDQLRSLRRWAAAEGREVVAELRDDGKSASRYAQGKVRGDWTKAVELIKAGDVDELAVWESSRMTRERLAWATLVDLCAERHVDIAVDGKVYDPTDPDDAHALDLDMARNVHESAKTSKRTLRGVESRAAEGRPHGTLNFGYRIEYDPQTGKALRRVVDPAKEAIVREIAGRLLAGESASGIARDLNARGVRGAHGGRWNSGNMTRMIIAPALAGLRVHRKRVLDDVRATWDPILTMDEHQRLLALVSDPERKSHRTGEHVRHLLVGVARCGVCGGRIRALTRKRTDLRVIVYSCGERFCVTRTAAEIDALVEAVVVGRLARPDFAAALAESADDPAVRTAGEEVARLRARLDEARRLVAEDELSLESLVEIERRTLPALQAAEKRAQPRHVPDAVHEVAGADAPTLWEATPIAARREIVHALLDVRIRRSPRRNQHEPPHLESIDIQWKAS